MFGKIFNKPAQRASSPRTCVAPDERVYAIGDVHGRQDLLDAILEKISQDLKQFSDARRPRIVFLGDYIDRGDQSSGVLDTLSGFAKAGEAIAQETGVTMDFLAGNHEIAMLGFLDDPVKAQSWLDWGGLQTLASFGIAPPSGRNPVDLMELREELMAAVAPFKEFLLSLKRLEISGTVVFVHAGLDPDAPLDAQPDAATLWGQAPSGKALGMTGYKVVHGHFASYEPVSLQDRICVDTGAYFSGRLTAVRLDDDETFLHVDTADLPLPSEFKLTTSERQ